MVPVNPAPLFIIVLLVYSKRLLGIAAAITAMVTRDQRRKQTALTIMNAAFTGGLKETITTIRTFLTGP